MSLIAIAALSLAAASPAVATPPAPVPPSSSTITASDWRAVVATAHSVGIPSRTLYRAMTAQETPRRSPRQQRLCILRAMVVAGKTGHVCRTGYQWSRLGIAIPANGPREVLVATEERVSPGTTG